MTVASQNFQMRQFHWDVVIYGLTKVTSRQSPKSKNKTAQSGFGLWQQPMRLQTLQTRSLRNDWWCQSLTATQMPCEKRKKAPSELKWHSLLSQSLALFLFLPLRGWNSVKHALVLTWDGYGNMFPYPRLLFYAKSFTGGLIQTGRREEMLNLKCTRTLLFQYYDAWEFEIYLIQYQSLGINEVDVKYRYIFLL